MLLLFCALESPLTILVLCVVLPFAVIIVRDCLGTAFGENVEDAWVWTAPLLARAVTVYCKVVFIASASLLLLTSIFADVIFLPVALGTVDWICCGSFLPSNEL